MRAIVAAAAPMIATATVNGAEFTLEHRPGLKSVIRMSGEIMPGDEDKFLQVVAPGAFLLKLDSPGGNLLAALVIGNIVEYKKIHTMVADIALCASACLLDLFTPQECANYFAAAGYEPY